MPLVGFYLWRHELILRLTSQSRRSSAVRAWSRQRSRGITASPQLIDGEKAAAGASAGARALAPYERGLVTRSAQEPAR